jgi:hypothetical protein
MLAQWEIFCAQSIRTDIESLDVIVLGTMVPKVGTPLSSSSLPDVLFGQTHRAILDLLSGAFLTPSIEVPHGNTFFRQKTLHS